MTNYGYDVLSFKEARRHLRVSQPVFNALVSSRLLGNYFADGHVLVAAVRHYEFFGTQWITEDRDDITDRMLTAEFIESMPPPRDTGEGAQTGVHTMVCIMSDDMPDIEEASATDTGWLAHFYLTPNAFFFPAPTTLGMIGGGLLKLDAPRKVPGTQLPTCLYPDPGGSLGMVAVYGNRQPLEKAYERAYDIVAPILDELSAKYDQPLPIAHNLIVQIPSGLMTMTYAKVPRTKTLSRGEPVLPACPYPELRETVALYREGVSSNNPFHQFLTLWKTYENACEVRGAWRREHKKDKRSDIKIRAEVIPDSVFGFGSYGRLTFDQAKQRMERPYRVALAHGSDIRDGKPITAASAEDLMSVAFKVPIIRYMAQVTLDNVRATLAPQQAERPQDRTP